MAQQDSRQPPTGVLAGEGGFTPRPEAQALKWNQLLSSTRKATRELLLWLRAAVDTSTSPMQDEQLATSLLISGDRGSGKTTVLLTAASAFKSPDDFIPESSGPEALVLRDDVIKKLQQRVVWLDTLDLEPLPGSANLLATLLVRVRAALDRGPRGLQHEQWTPPSLLEKEVENPWGQLDRLVRDATFMWEGITGADAHQRTEQQLKAADIYAQFQHNFIQAMEKVSETLTLWHFGYHGGKSREPMILLLPIDNVDRSIVHLHNILKLTRMVACRQLWFVLAAGRSDFQLFLERSFQMEMTAAGKSGLGRGGDDETLSITRRQAAAAMRRVLPPIHRIGLQPVSAEEAWRFSPDVNDGTPALSELLEQLPLRMESERPIRNLAHLINLEPRLGEDLVRECQAREQPRDACPAVFFSPAGRLALTLPARNLVDLWQITHHEVRLWVEADLSRNEMGERAIEIVSRMLRNAIDESELPGWASQQLQRRILRRNEQNHIVLDLTGNPIQRLKLTSLSEVLRWPLWADPPEERKDPELLRTELHLRRYHEVLLELHDLDEPRNRVPLPPHVAGWFMLLHDMLMFCEDAPRVMNIGTMAFEATPELVVTQHEALLVQPGGLVELDFWWSPPGWNTFVEFAIFTTQWKAFLQRAKGLLQPPIGRPEELRAFSSDRFRLVLAAWIDNVCAVAGPARGRWVWEKGLSDVLPSEPESQEAARGREDSKVPQHWRRFDEHQLGNYEQQVCTRVSELYGYIQRESTGNDQLWVARRWLEQVLPLFLQPEFAPEAGLAKVPSELRQVWSRDAFFLARHRYESVRETVEKSKAFLALKGGYGPDSERGPGVCRQWVREACATWFQLMGDSLRRETLEEAPGAGEARH